jgi:hypothetical protein
VRKVVPRPPGDDPAAAFRSAERRLRGALLGDGVYEAGLVKGDEARTRVARELRLMHEAFYAAVAAGGSVQPSGESEAPPQPIEKGRARPR